MNNTEKKFFYILENKKNGETSETPSGDNRQYFAQTYNKPGLFWPKNSFKPITGDYVYGEKVIRLSTGEEIPHDEITFAGNTYYEEVKEKDKYYYGFSVEVVDLVTVEKDDVFVKVKFFTRDIIFIGKRKKYGQRSMTGLTFNCKTGQTYYLPRTCLDAGKKIQSFVSGSYPRRVSTKYYEWDSIPTLPDVVVDYIEKSILELKKETLGFYPMVYKEAFNNITSYLISLNENPKNNLICTAKGMLTQYAYNKVKKSEDQIAGLFDAFGVPQTKQLRKLFFKFGADVLLNYRIIQETTGFQKKDNLYLLATCRDKKAIIYSFLSRICPSSIMIKKNKLYHRYRRKEFSIHNSEERQFNEIDLILSMSEFYKNETIVTRKIARSSYLPGDTWRSACQLRDLANSNKIQYGKKNVPFDNKEDVDKYILKILKSDFGKKEHDDASSVYDLCANENFEIPYMEEELKLEESSEGFSILLAKDTMELKKIGRELNICVGSYANYALTKGCTILHVIKDNVEKVCIELIKNRVVQVKGYGNSLIVGDTEGLYLFVKNWIQKNSLDASQCGDFISAAA